MLARVLMSESAETRVRINELVIHSSFGWGNDEQNEVSGADIGRRTSVMISMNALATAQDSIARDVSRVLREWLGEEIELRARRAETGSTVAWTLYQRAERLRKDALQTAPAEAVQLLERADSLLAAVEQADPAWIEPIVLRAEVAGISAPRSAAVAARRTVEAGIAHAERALARAPNHPRALEARGTLRYMIWYFQPMWFPERDAVWRERTVDMAQRDLEAAVAADGSLASAYALLSHLHHEARKDLVSSALTARNAYAADAFVRNADQILERLFWAHYNLAQFQDARRWCDEGGRRFPHDWRFIDCRLHLLVTPDAPPDPEAGWELVSRLDSVTPENQRAFIQHRSRQIVAGILARAGFPDSARSVLAGARAQDLQTDPTGQLPLWEAVVRAQMGDPDTAVTRLREYVVANPDHAFQRDGTIHWWWIPLRDHPEFRQLLAAGR
jgi:eukaryotic-like serine/threonine-protein kinase